MLIIVFYNFVVNKLVSEPLVFNNIYLPKTEELRLTLSLFFKVFTIIFPAFTGIAAGLGLSGDLKDPKKSLPAGTMWATITGMIIYVFLARL